MQPLDVALFVVGAAVGSFLNVLTLRYDPDGRLFDRKIVAGRSRCPHCRRTLRWYELVPVVSYLALAGRCRTCHAPLSFQYPLLELAGGLMFLYVPRFLAAFYGVGLPGASVFGSPIWFYLSVGLWLLVFLAWLTIAIIDLRHFIIPDELNLTLVVAGAILVVVLLLGQQAPNVPFRESFLRHYALLFAHPASLLVNRLIGVVAGVLVFGALSFLSRGRAMGFGDVKLAAASGLVLGWPDIALSVALSFMIGGVCGAVLLATGRKSRRDRLPFAPFFVAGSVLTVFFGADLIAWYFKLFGS